MLFLHLVDFVQIPHVLTLELLKERWDSYVILSITALFMVNLFAIAIED